MSVFRLAILLFIFQLSNAISNTQKPDFTCHPGDQTTVIANSCANVWPTKNPKYRWPDLHANCDPNFLLCDSPKNNPPFTLISKNCLEVKIQEVIPEEHLAEVQCINPRTSENFFINIDLLSCHSKNVLQYQEDSNLKRSESSSIGKAIVARAEVRMREMKELIKKDTEVLLDLVAKTQPELLKALLKKGYNEITDLLLKVMDKQDLNFICEPISGERIESGDGVRAQRTCRLLKFTYEFGTKLFDYSKKESFARIGFENAINENYVLKEMIRTPYFWKGKANETDALSRRMLILYAFKNKNPELFQKMKLIRKSVETGVHEVGNSHIEYFWELHSGFVYGGHRLEENSGGGYDCSDFVSSILLFKSSDDQDISTTVLKKIARYLGGESTDRSLSNGEKAIASCFTLVEPRNGDLPEPGDILVSLSDLFDNRHAAIVKQVFPNHVISTYEAAGGASNTILVKTRPLFELQPHCKTPEPNLPMRPDLYLLRLKPSKPDRCPLGIGG